MAFDNFCFLNFMDINIENFADINFTIVVTETLCFWHPVWSSKLWTFWNFFSEIYVSWSNCDTAFCIYKDIWKQSKTIIIVAVSINVITNYIFIIIPILYIMAELIELHELTLIAFPFPFDCKRSYGRTEIISTNLSSPRTQTHTQLFPALWDIL